MIERVLNILVFRIRYSSTLFSPGAKSNQNLIDQTKQLSRVI